MKFKLREIRQNAENKQTFALTGKIKKNSAGRLGEELEALFNRSRPSHDTHGPS